MAAKVIENEESETGARGYGPGTGVDAHGAPVIDPTKNVLDLVHAESRYQDGMRDQLEKYEKGMRRASDRYQEGLRTATERYQGLESRLQNWQRESESKRIDQLLAQADKFGERIANMLSTSVQSTSSLVSTQLVQIQATFDARVSKLEQFRWESGGRSSVADPQLADSLNRMANAITANRDTEIAALEKMAMSISILKETGKLGEGRSKGIGDSWSAIATGIAAIWASAATIGLMFELFAKH